MDAKIKLKIYTTDSGESPFVDWIESLDKQIRYRVKERLDRITLGNKGDHKPIQSGISEFRFTFGSGYRIYYGEDQGNIVLLLCGGDKSSQKRDIKKAIAYWHDYLGGEQ